MKKKNLFVVLTALVISLSMAGCAGLSRSDDKELLYVALGASDAVGIGAIPLTKGYVFRIKNALEDEHQAVTLLNLGVPSVRINTVEPILDKLLHTGTQPDLVTIWLGSNEIINGDDPEDFETRLEKILAQLREHTSAVIVIADIPDLTEIPRFIDHPSKAVTEERIEAFNEVIEKQADEFDAPISRLSELELADELVSDIDGFHPNNNGHRIIAEQFLKIIFDEFDLP
ncbi:MAG: SGNH/GDSL hydrolase family protein [Gammaproteobacteria bacterium]